MVSRLVVICLACVLSTAAGAQTLPKPVVQNVPAPAPTGTNPGDPIQVPEPGDAALFAIAVVGLILGRQASRRPPHRGD